MTENLETNKRLALCKHHFLPTDFVDEKQSLLRFGVVPHSHKSVEVVHAPTTAAPSTRKGARTLSLFDIDTDVHAPVIPMQSAYALLSPTTLMSNESTEKTAPSHTPTSISGSPVKVFDDSDSVLYYLGLHFAPFLIVYSFSDFCTTLHT